MHRVFVAAGSLLLCGAITPPSVVWSGAAGDRTEPLVFVFLRVDRDRDVAILRPMVAPDIGVQLDLPAARLPDGQGQAGSGPRKLERGTVLQCHASARAHDAIVEGEVAKVSEILLDCGDQTFVVKTLEFAPHRK